MREKKPSVLTHGEILLLTDNPHFSAEESRKEQRDADVAFFQAEIGKLKPLSDEERGRVQIDCDSCPNKPQFLAPFCLDCIAKHHNQAQLAKTKEDLMKVME